MAFDKKANCARVRNFNPKVIKYHATGKMCSVYNIPISQYYLVIREKYKTEWESSLFIVTVSNES